MATLLVFVIDAVLVVLFATFGRGAHSGGLGVAQVWETAWPFLVGLVVGWVFVLATRRASTAVGTGVLLWVFTLLLGMVIRGLTEGRVPHWSFMLVAGITIAVFLIGWRAVTMAVRRRGAGRRTMPDPMS